MAKKEKPRKTPLWGGRFKTKVDADFFHFSTSLPEDVRLYPYELKVNLVYAEALFQKKWLSSKEKQTLQKALRTMQKENPPKAGYEDIHSYIEDRLGSLCGQAAQKLHLGRSRNDLVLTSLRLYLKDVLPQLEKQIQDVQFAILEKAKQEVDTLLPAFTHRQPAQPTTLAHLLLAYFFGFQRDRIRGRNALKVADVLPLGSCSAVGTGVDLPQREIARALGFKAIVQNSLDMVGDRDFLLDLLHMLSLLQIRLSRLSEDILFLAHPYLGGITLPEALCTGSSAMPQKKNPDALELIRARTGRSISAYVQLSTVLKGLGSSYHRDLQEDKAPVFMSVQNVAESLALMGKIVAGMQVHKRQLAALLKEDLLALDIAEILAKKGMPFRQSHAKVGQWIKEAERKGKTLLQIAKGKGLEKSLSFSESIARKATIGSPGKKALRLQFQQARQMLKS